MKDISGQKFGLWTAIEPVGKNEHRIILWKCKCDCGTVRVVSGMNLRKGTTRSCGCAPHKIKHGNTKGNQPTRLYTIWREMRQRCRSHKSKRYFCRGIKVCDEWQQFLPFEKWALEHGYKDDLTIDRIDNDGDYQPDNCRWISRYDQARNRSTNIFITYNGKTQIALDWAKELGISYSTITRRYKKGWNDEECLFGKTNSCKSHDYSIKEKQIFITHNGITKNLYQWSKALNINYNTLMNRHKKGWSDEECLFGRRKS